eukprot:1152259-Pelagomonas_calceolata.AAC.1
MDIDQNYHFQTYQPTLLPKTRGIGWGLTGRATQEGEVHEGKMANNLPDSLPRLAPNSPEGLPKQLAKLRPGIVWAPALEPSHLKANLTRPCLIRPTKAQRRSEGFARSKLLHSWAPSFFLLLAVLPSGK